VACEALWQLGLDEVRLVPARRPPHKPGASIAPAEQRAAWLEEAVAGRAGLSVSRIELEREGPSYTADTLEAMAAAEPGTRLWFIHGSDQLAGFPGWHDPGRILRHARLAVVGRGGEAGAGLRALADRVAPGRADVLDVPPIGVSASMIRARLAAGQPVGHLLPAAVEQALVRGGLVPSPSVAIRKEPPRPRSS
jgi:nicotinate-nucleotide adenylyltransferase